MKTTLARRIATLERDYRRAKLEGRDIAPYLRRSRSLSAAYLAMEEVRK